jgi:hypothetical protein
MRSGVYIVPTNQWYIERAVWLIAGIVLLTSTALAYFVQPLFILGVTATGLTSIIVGITGFCPVSNVLHRLGMPNRLGPQEPSAWYRMKTDKWYLERKIYPFVGFNISTASILTLVWTHWFMAFTAFVGVAMVWFAATGFCIMANGLYWLGAEPRLTKLPEESPKPISPELSPTPSGAR